MLEHAYAVILAGGRGERFWPLSTAQRPKQLLSLVGNETLLAQAASRIESLIPPERVFVITNEDLLEASQEAAPKLPAGQIIGEPVGRDTAAAVALGAALVKARDPEGVFCILTADHVMGDLELFRTTLRESLALAARDNVLVTIGIRPTDPSTAYGYIEVDRELEVTPEIRFHAAKRFVEKPDASTAAEYVEAGKFFWNSGMFIWSVASIEAALCRHRPQLAEMMTRLCVAADTPAFAEAFRKEYAELEKISIDYAVMEKADNIVMAEGTFAWDDVGSWTALENHFAADPGGNLLIGDVQVLDAKDNLIFSRDRLTAVIGVEGLVVVQAPGATLVCPKEKAQQIKQMVQQLRATNRHGEVL